MVFGLSNRVVTLILLFASSYCLWAYLDGYYIRSYASFIPLLFAVQVLLSDLIEYYVLKRMRFGSYPFIVFMAPGTILHELSHFFAALFSGCYITGMSLFKPNPKTGMLGYVNYRTPLDKWIVLREFVIAFAPFFGCGSLMIMLNYLQGGDLVNVVNSVQLNVPEDFIGAFIHTSSIMTSSFLSMDYGSILSWIMLYLQMCFAVGAAPSSIDFKGSFKNLYTHPISTLFTLIILWLMLFFSEEPWNLAGVESNISWCVKALLWFTITVLLASSTLLLLMLPLAFLFSKMSEISGVYKLIPPALSSSTIALMHWHLGFQLKDSLTAGLLVLTASYIILRDPKSFVKSRRR
ncbi:MAG: hypothetical protein ABIH11_01135 [Candidatus Altiarchaeota archaeon]